MPGKQEKSRNKKFLPAFLPVPARQRLFYRKFYLLGCGGQVECKNKIKLKDIHPDRLTD